MSEEIIDSYQAFADGYEDIPEEKFPLRPEVMALVEVAEASDKMNTRVPKGKPIPQIQVTLKIIEAATVDGKTAKGNLMDWLSSPEKGHEGQTEAQNNFQRQQFGKATAAFLAPEAKEKEAKDTLVLAAARTAGGFPQALLGKRAIVKIGINDGVNKKTGAIVSQARHDDPRNRIDNYIPATEANINKYVRGIA